MIEPLGVRVLQHLRDVAHQLPSCAPFVAREAELADGDLDLDAGPREVGHGDERAAGIVAVLMDDFNPN